MTTVERPARAAGLTSTHASGEQEIRDRRVAWLLLVGGAVGLLAAFTLAVERVSLISDADYTPTCSINPVLSCGSVMQTDQASVLGFPNPFIGVAAFPLVLATGAALLAGARLARWYWVSLQVGVSLGLGFVGWLIFQSVYRIGALCPYCMVVWAVVIPIALYVTARNLGAGVLGRGTAPRAAGRVLAEWHLPVLVAGYLLVVGVITIEFWYYWSTLLP